MNKEIPENSRATADQKVIMFGGKGGVGKTTCSAATALHYSQLGKKTLVISTDVTPSISHIFDVMRGHGIVCLDNRLFVMELGINEVKELWDRKFGREVYEVFSTFVSITYEDFTDFMTSVLPGLADEFMIDYTRELVGSKEFDVVVWDTAPMGQTLALLKTLQLLVRHLRMAPRVYSRLKMGGQSRENVLKILKRWERLSASNMDFLKNQVELNLVIIAEALAVYQLDSIIHELKDAGIAPQQLIVNNLAKNDGSNFLKRKTSQQQEYLDIIRQKYSTMRIIELPMFPEEIRGSERIGRLAEILFTSIRF